MRELTSTDLRSNVMSMQERFVEEDLAPFGIVDDGHDETAIEKVVRSMDDNWIEYDAMGFRSVRQRPMLAVSDDSWLLND
jgi:hypothetical protein